MKVLIYLFEDLNIYYVIKFLNIQLMLKSSKCKGDGDDTIFFIFI